MMRRILVPVDGSENSERAIRHAISLFKENPSVELLVLNVQLPIESGLVHQFIGKELIDRYYADEGAAMLASAKQLLDDAGVRYTASVATGHIGETIANYANQQRCDHIVMGTRGMGALKNLVVGSIATKVIHLVEVPVTLVK
jgi:nucleotide-binding universal stress UspA family protein